MDIHDVHYIYTFVCCLNLHAYIDQDIVPKIHFATTIYLLFFLISTWLTSSQFQSG